MARLVAARVAETSTVDRQRSWLDGLNDRQRAAVLHDGGPLLVIAGAGSGKTRTLAYRVARLVADGVPAERILLLTFTRRAAADMVRRATDLLLDRRLGDVWGGTFHSTANRLLRRHAGAVGLDPSFTVLDQGDAADLFGLVRTDFGLGEGKNRFPKKQTIAAVYSRSVNAQESLKQVLEQRFPWCSEHADALREVFVEYTARKRSHNVLDFDDMLLYWRALMQSDSGATVAAMFDHVLVDEYQDTNAVQADILDGMAAEHGNVTAVGDDAQSIYSFRAASAENMAGFPDRFPGTTIVALEQNYRSTPEILAVANAVLAESTEIYPKELWSERRRGPRPELATTIDEAAEADWVCDRVLELREQGTPLTEQAVLFRTGHHSAVLELALSRRDIPFVKFGGLRFLEAAHVKDLLALLRILDNAEDVLAWHRVLGLLPGVGPATARRWIEVTAGAGAAARRVAGLQTVVEVPEGAGDLLGELSAALADCSPADGSEPPPAVQIDRLLGLCSAVFATTYPDAEARLVDLEQLREIAKGYATRTDFLTELTLDPPNSTSDLAGPPHLDDDYLTLSTIHSAKGAEWASVVVLHAADGNIPSDMALNEPGGLEEERRLMYVALTRAKDRLAVTFPQRFYHRRFSASHAAHTYAMPSRFLASAEPHFDRVGLAPPPGTPTAADVPRAPDPVAPLLESLWG